MPVYTEPVVNSAALRRAEICANKNRPGGFALALQRYLSGRRFRIVTRIIISTPQTCAQIRSVFDRRTDESRRWIASILIYKKFHTPCATNGLVVIEFATSRNCTRRFMEMTDKKEEARENIRDNSSTIASGRECDGCFLKKFCHYRSSSPVPLFAGEWHAVNFFQSFPEEHKFNRGIVRPFPHRLLNAWCIYVYMAHWIALFKNILGCVIFHILSTRGHCFASRLPHHNNIRSFINAQLFLHRLNPINFRVADMWFMACQYSFVQHLGNISPHGIYPTYTSSLAQERKWI